jgi:hypothetical protein
MTVKSVATTVATLNTTETMKKTPFETLRDRTEEGLRKVCGRISPERRIVLVAALMLLFAVVNCRIMIKGICAIGRENARIERTELPPQGVPAAEGGDPATDSLGSEFKRFFNAYSKSEDNDTDNEQEQGQR